MNMNLGVPINREVEDTVKYIHLEALLGTLYLHTLFGNHGYYIHGIVSTHLGEGSIQETVDSFGPKEQRKHFKSEKRPYDQ